jgi:hypothetical protein
VLTLYFQADYSSTPVAASSTGTWADVPAPSATPAAYTPKAPVSPYTGSASKMAGAGLAGVAAVAALLL